jgi:hypothetical protein
VARSRAPQRAVSRSGAPSLRSRACSGRNGARTHAERSGPWPTTHRRIPPPAAATPLVAVPFFTFHRWFLSPPPYYTFSFPVAHVRRCYRVALAPRPPQTATCAGPPPPPTISRRSPERRRAPLATPTLKADEHPAPPHPRAPNLSSSARLPSRSRIAIVLSAAAPCRSQHRRQRRLPRQRGCQGRKYEQGEVMGCSPKRSSR